MNGGAATSEFGRVSRVSPVHTARRNCTRDEGGPFEVGNQVLISSHRKLLLSKATVVNIAEKSGRDPSRALAPLSGAICRQRVSRNPSVWFCFQPCFEFGA